MRGRAATAPSVTTASSDGLVDIGAGLDGRGGLVATVASVGVANVAAMAEDGQGRLWLGTADYSDSGSDGVYLVVDARSDPLLVIGEQHTVLGLVWVGDELFVASKERVDAYSGFDGSSFATHRTVVEFEAGVGEVNGIAAGPTVASRSASRRRATRASRPSATAARWCRSSPTAPTCARWRRASADRSG